MTEGSLDVKLRAHFTAFGGAVQKHWPIGIIVAALFANDLVTWVELRHTTSWLLGSLDTPAAFSILLLANAVTAAFFFEGLEDKYVKRLHAVAGFLYLTIAVAVYAAGVQHGIQHFPPDVARAAFHLPQHRAVMLGAVIVGAALALTTLVFWSVIGALIQLHVARQRIARRARSEEIGQPVANVLNLADRPTREELILTERPAREEFVGREQRR